MKNVVKKKRGRKTKPANQAYESQQIKILSALTLYFSTGSPKQVERDLKIPHPTLLRWLGQYTELVEEAKKRAAERTEIRLTEIIDLSLDRQITNLKSKNDITPGTINCIMGTAIDKLCLVQGKPVDGAPIQIQLNQSIVMALHEIRKQTELDKLSNANDRIKSHIN